MIEPQVISMFVSTPTVSVAVSHTLWFIRNHYTT